ncbi:sporulation sigma factor SigF [compost metagenome]|uniref:DNA-directed RNA polymerase specialized sigma subunit n=1 Tax=Fontibacillus solani TaxID=1572857 RepID=A0A7W3XQ37_9BACL|nr:sigma-70 family RNA polymerase sigma factor [Fontibacillus solani]MBA9084197.1 DNA-directed RNA polymerase specialized sigma subunit [Fontibacillus solani]
MKEQQTAYEQYRREVYRIAWRVQYKAKVVKRRECSFNGIEPATTSFTSSSDNKIVIRQMINALPSSTGRTIIYKIYMQDKTEREVALELNMSQQGVNKWKRKMIQELSRMMSS